MTITKQDLQVLRKDIQGDINKAIDNSEKKLSSQIKDVGSSLTEKIDNVESSLTEKIDDVESSLNEKIDNVESSLNEKIDTVDKKLDRHIKEASAEHKNTRELLRQSFRELSKLVDHDNRITKLEKNYAIMTTHNVNQNSV